MQEKDKTSISKQQKIIIKLNPNYHAGRANYIPSQEEELADLIVDRVRKYENFLKENSDLRDEDLYDALKRYDSIHINGARGSGKSTVIKFLAESQDCNVCSELQEKVEFLSIIDPNQLDKDTIIIDIVTDVIYSHATSYFKNKNQDRELYKLISDYKCQIDKLTFATHQQDYDNYVIRQETTREERKLDYTFHKYAEACCKLLGKKALVLPLDDIDMRLDKGVDILETIRKYFQTPHLIPVIALDSAQAYALVKKGYYKQFDFAAKVSHRDIESGGGMGFLKKLPSEYLEKILPPSQRIALYDMLDYYKDEFYFSHDKSKLKFKNHKPIYFYKELKNGTKNDKEVTLSFADMLKLIMNVLFDYKDAEDMFSPDDYRIVNYLKNKSFRSFLDDARALMRGLEYDEGFVYKDKALSTFRLNTGHLKTRFELYSRGSASNKYDGAMWFWDRYIDRVYAELDKVGKKDDYYKVDYIVTDLINEILVIDPHDTSSLGRKEKIYYRLFLQEFFIEETHIEFSEADTDGHNTIKQIIKTYNMQGYLEFIMRTLFPASMFEILVNDKIISVLKFPIEQLRDFASPNNKTTLKELYDEWLPFWTVLYPQKIKKLDDDGTEIEELEIFNPLAVEIQEDHTRSFRKVLSFTTRENYRRGEQTYYVHPFKIFSLLAEYHMDVSHDFYLKYIPKGYSNRDSGRLLSLKQRMQAYSHGTDYLKMSDELVILSIIDSIESVQNLSKNILLSILIKPQNIQQSFYQVLKEDYELEEGDINLLYKVELQKNISSSSAELINMILRIFLTQVNYMEIKSKKRHYISEAPKFDINSSSIRASLHEKSILMPYVKDDPLLRNIAILNFTPLREEDIFLNHLSMYFFTAELDRIYYPEKTLYNKSYFDYFYTGKQQRNDLIFSDTDALKRLIDTKLNLKKAYLQLFSKYLINKGLNKDFVKLYSKSEGINKEKVSAFIEKILKIKKDSSNSVSSYIAKNISILLIDSISIDDSTIPEIIKTLDKDNAS